MASTAPPYDLTQCLGFEYPIQEVSWTQRDLILYALSIGAHRDDFNLIYELDENFQAFPTYVTQLSFKGTAIDVVDFVKHFSNEPTPTGLPKFDKKKLGHASQFVEVLRPLPKVSGKGWTVAKKVVGIHELAAGGVIVDNEITVIDPDGTVFARLIAAAKNIGAKANGVEFHKIEYEPITIGKPYAELGDPTLSTIARGWPEQCVFYRLSGDYNPLHIDPSKGEALGYKGVLYHGLDMYAMTARAILEKMCNTDPLALKAIYARFAGPLYPGDHLKVKIWDLETKDGVTLIAFESWALNEGTICLSGGVAHIIKGSTIAEERPWP